MDVTPLTAGFGARIDGIDLSRPLDQPAMAALREIWLARGVILLRGQALSPADQVAFSRRLGELEPPPASEAGTREELGGQPIWYISNVMEDGRAIGSLGNAEAEWHTDMSYLPEPPSASVLYAREVPDRGGNTSFCDMAAVLDALPGDLRQAIAGRMLRHDASMTSAGELRRGAQAVTDVRNTQGAVHPIVRTHPETGRASLYLGRRTNAYIEGFDVSQSEALLDALWAFVRDPRFAWEHVWRAGDLLVWDNRCLMHRRDAFDAGARRIMLRTQVKGDRPH
jgi:taurine dioxygenase